MLKQGGQPTASLKIVPLSEVYFPFVTSSDTPKADLAQKDELGGLLRLRPSTRQVVLANRAINANGGGGNGFLPTALDARSGQVTAPLPATRGRVPSLQPHAPSLQPHAPSLRPHTPSLRPHAPSLQPQAPPPLQVPVFYSERVVLQDEGGGSSFPFFFSKVTPRPDPDPNLNLNPNPNPNPSPDPHPNPNPP